MTRFEEAQAEANRRWATVEPDSWRKLGVTWSSWHESGGYIDQGLHIDGLVVFDGSTWTAQRRVKELRWVQKYGEFSLTSRNTDGRGGEVWMSTALVEFQGVWDPDQRRVTYVAMFDLRGWLRDFRAGKLPPDTADRLNPSTAQRFHCWKIGRLTPYLLSEVGRRAW